MRRWLLGIAVTVLLVTGCAGPHVPDPSSEESAAVPAGAGAGAAGAAGGEQQRQTVRIAAVGDSITHGRSPEFAAGALSERSWIPHAVGGGVELVGGWARGGATTAEMLDHVTPVDADVLVILAGTNDVLQGVTDSGHGRSLTNIRAIARTVGAQNVVLSAIPPLNRRPAAAAAFNDSLRELAQNAGWHWVDGPAPLRDGTRFLPEMTHDGIHPTPEGADTLGKVLRGAVLDAAD